MIDYLAQRQNVIREAPLEELNSYLATIAKELGKGWLERDDNNPIQVLWKRNDGLATNELFLLGQAIEAMLQANAAWTRRQIKRMKSTDAGTRAGAIFEVLGLNLFATSNQKVEPAKEGNPGYDGRIVMKDGSSLVLSLKNHGISSNERNFRKEAVLALRDFLASIQKHSRSGISLRTAASSYPGAQDWKLLRESLDAILMGTVDPEKMGVWVGAASFLSEYAPFSARHLSYSLFIVLFGVQF